MVRVRWLGVRLVDKGEVGSGEVGRCEPGRG